MAEYYMVLRTTYMQGEIGKARVNIKVVDTNAGEDMGIFYDLYDQASKKARKETIEKKKGLERRFNLDK